jgi:hypothetical protein
VDLSENDSLWRQASNKSLIPAAWWMQSGSTCRIRDSQRLLRLQHLSELPGNETIRRAAGL